MKFDIIEWCEDNISNVRMTSTKQLVGDCPWCGKSGHFYVDSEEGHYICFACSDENPSSGRYLVGAIAQVEGISITEARKFIMRNRIEFRRKETLTSLTNKISKIANEKIIHRNVYCELPTEFISVYKDGKWSYPIYLKERNIKRNTAKVWGLGWARKGRYGGRIIIPISCPNGKSFTSRDVTGKQIPKYLNPEGAEHSRLLFGWEFHKINEDVVLVEGPMDAIKLWQHGFSVLALMGKVLYVEQLMMLAKKPQDCGIIIMLDPEEIEAPYDVADQLIYRFDNVYIAKLPHGIDPGSSTKSQAHKAVSEAILYKGNRINRITDIITKSKFKLRKIYE